MSVLKFTEDKLANDIYLLRAKAKTPSSDFKEGVA